MYLIEGGSNILKVVKSCTYTLVPTIISYGILFLVWKMYENNLFNINYLDMFLVLGIVCGILIFIYETIYIFKKLGRPVLGLLGIILVPIPAIIYELGSLEFILTSIILRYYIFPGAIVWCVFTSIALRYMIKKEKK